MGRPRKRLALEALERLDLAGEGVRAMRAAFPDAVAGTRTRLDIGSLRGLAVDWLAAGFGGVRPLWRCPSCCAARRVLYIVGRRLACRGCLRSNGRPLIYSSQRHDPSMRAQVRGDALAARLGGDHGRCAPDKPPRMWWRTYWRIAERIVELEEQRYARLCSGRAG